MPQIPPFALPPGSVGFNMPINYAVCLGAELYRAGSSSIPIKSDEEEEHLSVFTDVLTDCS